jgi:scyllo-inosose 3-dehydrogenase
MIQLKNDFTAEEAAGIDMLPLIKKKVGLDAIPEQIVQLRTNRTDCKITYVAD